MPGRPELIYWDSNVFLSTVCCPRAARLSAAPTQYLTAGRRAPDFPSTPAYK